MSSINSKIATSAVFTAFANATDQQNFFANVTAEEIVREHGYEAEDTPLFADALLSLQNMFEKAEFDFDQFDVETTENIVDEISAIYAKAWGMAEAARWLGDDLTSEEIEVEVETKAKEFVRNSDDIKTVTITSFNTYTERIDHDVLYFLPADKIAEFEAACR